ncbi:Uncharacterised protein [Mycobacteroides abscessus subsp. massiliense]|nr:Uncharacterised protein [Mycobacteroides abscessus subsp. massiliense]
MQAPVLVGVGVRLVAGIDDAALERCLQAHLDLDVVGTLGKLEARIVTGRPDAHAARSGDDLARDEERGQPGNNRGERCLTIHQIVLMSAVRGTLAVDVVLVQL